MSLRFRLLGEVQVTDDSRPVGIKHARVLDVLVALLVDMNLVVPIDTLVERVWGEHLPANPRAALMTQLSRLRTTLAGGDDIAINRRGAGYQLTGDTEAVDLHRFRRLRAEARSAGTDELTASLLAEALGEWTGEAFSGLDAGWLADVRATLSRERLATQLDYHDVQLRLGRHSDLVADLTELAGAHPLDERLTAQLMLALHRSGRQADALRSYQQIRLRLAEELGVDPGPALRELHQQILTDDTTLSGRPQPSVVPRQLPADVAGFTGRADYLKSLDELVPGITYLAPVVVSALSGMAGIGKTTLVVHWAHRIAEHFPDGQLYVNLRGFDASGSVLTPAEAVRGFLDALAVAPEQIPAGLEAQVGLYRSLMAERRMLIVLDNARDADQVRPLLPGAGGSLVVVTSRNQLAGLVATNNAHATTLGLLSVQEAEDLLAGRLGADRVAEEPEAVAEIIAHCGRLPLALAVVAARAATRPTFALGSLAAELSQSERQGELPAGTEPSTDIQSVFSWSYHALSPRAARAFRLLSGHPGSVFTVNSAASLIALPLATARRLLAELTEAHMLAEHSPGQYTFHDLLRVYASHQSSDVDSGDERAEALRRVLDHYLHTGFRAAMLFYPQRRPIELPAPRPGVTPVELTDHSQALAWLAAEHATVVAAAQAAAEHGFLAHSWRLAWTLADFMDRNGHWREHAAVQRIALTAAEQAGDLEGQSHAHRGIARSSSRVAAYQDAQDHLTAALDLVRQLGDKVGQAHLYLNFTTSLLHQGRFADALAHAMLALELYGSIGARVGVSEALNAVGWCHALLGDFEQSLVYCQQALDMHVELGARLSEADTLDSLGYAHHHLGDHAEAIACYRRALAINRELDDRSKQGEVLTHLGDAHLAAGEIDEARQAWQQAVTALDTIGSPHAEEVRAKLAACPSR